MASSDVKWPYRLTHYEWTEQSASIKNADPNYRRRSKMPTRTTSLPAPGGLAIHIDRNPHERFTTTRSRSCSDVGTRDYGTTLRYIREAEAVRGGLGEPFPALPPYLLDSPGSRLVARWRHGPLRMMSTPLSHSDHANGMWQAA